MARPNAPWHPSKVGPTLSTIPPASIGRRCGLILSAGGARGAYQAGALRAIGELTRGGPSPFDIVTGTSAGAVNGAFLAARSHQFEAGTRELSELWEQLLPSHVYRTGARSLTRIAAGWAKDLAFGGALHRSSSTHLLDTAPLRALIEERIDFEQLRKNVENQQLWAVGFSATNYATGSAVTFYDSHRKADWVRSNRISEYTRLNANHVLASASIPFLFSPVQIGHTYYGDGALRLRAPLSAAIHLGAERLLAISVRRLQGRGELIADNQLPMAAITTADIAGVVLNAIFLDTLEADLEGLARINRLLRATRPSKGHVPEALRVVPALVIHPSVDLGDAATTRFRNVPRSVQYLLRGIGADERSGSNLLSYVAFHHDYTRYLVECGYEDTMRRASDIRAFLSAAQPVGDESAALP